MPIIALVVFTLATEMRVKMFLDSSFQIIPNFYPPLTEKVRQGINASLRLILEKRVLPTLYHLFDNARLDLELRNNLKSSFKEFCYPSAPIKGLCSPFISHLTSTIFLSCDVLFALYFVFPLKLIPGLGYRFCWG